MSLPKRAVTILRQVKRAILAEPELYDQREFPQYRTHDCGTPGCIAGWIEWVVNPDPKAYNAKLGDREKFSTETMAETLGISRVQAFRLFSGWPDAGHAPAWCNPRTVEAAKDAAKHIERFIRHGGNWD